ncbi:MAG: PAS domain-containing protein [Rhodospirillales bacterium]|nr:PAS domain-containing protein [Rhodospirillales bacterium]
MATALDRPAAESPTLTSVDGIERRACNLALQYWRELAAPRHFPSREQVTADTAAELWDHLFIVEVTDDPGSYIYVHAGAVLKAALGADPTGRKLADVLPPSICNRELYVHKTAAALRNPIDEAGKWTRGDGEDVLYRTVLLPLSDDQRQINYLLGAFSFRTTHGD